ncbi:DUF3969 family protein [Acinetobacter bereziniae]|uniref:DUF3969 family protein n=1 Tax=Acinetobacter bereziniae TaxID=106648 RepID=UPI00300A378C
MNSFDQFGKNDLKKLILLVNLGILHSLKNDYITFHEAEYFLYAPYMINLLKENKYSKSLIDVIHRGKELEDLESFNIDVKNEMKKMFNECEELIKQLPESSFQFGKWYDQKLFNNFK